MNTATITLHTAHNNGSFLQAYALQKIINKMGHSNSIINFVPRAQYSLYQNIIFKELSAKGIIKGILNVPNYSALKKRKDRFNGALDSLKLTSKFDNEDDFFSISEKFDCLIAGSDQIWNNASMPDFSNLYLLPVNKYKISYAPSFGKSLKDQFGSEILNQINQFDYLSVREQSVQQVLGDLLPSREVKVVLDPTFLLDKEEYEELSKNANCKYNGDYIFFYCIKATNDVLKAVKEISKILNMPVVTVFTGVNTYKCQAFGQKVDFSAGPSEFLHYVQNAKYVISNSFHGVVFSIIYNKTFFRIADNEDGKIKIDERLDSILNMLGLSVQNVITNSSISLNTDIDYAVANEKMSDLRNESLGWLQEALSDIQIKVDEKKN